MAKGGGQKVNRTELAGVFGVSLPTVDAWVRAGCPYDEKGNGKGSPWVFDTADVARWKERKARDEVGNTADEDAIKRRKLLASTQLEEMELAKRRGELVPVDQITRKLSNVFVEIRTNLRNIPSGVVSQLIGETDERRFKAVMLASIDDALSALSELDVSVDDDDDIEDEDE